MEVFLALQTQWRTGMGGPTGLDYGAVLPVLELLEIPAADRRTVFAKLRLMEYTALEQMAMNRK